MSAPGRRLCSTSGLTVAVRTSARLRLAPAARVTSRAATRPRKASATANCTSIRRSAVAAPAPRRSATATSAAANRWRNTVTSHDAHTLTGLEGAPVERLAARRAREAGEALRREPRAGHRVRRRAVDLRADAGVQELPRARLVDPRIRRALPGLRRADRRVVRHGERDRFVEREPELGLDLPFGPAARGCLGARSRRRGEGGERQRGEPDEATVNHGASLIEAGRSALIAAAGVGIEIR